MTIKYLKNYFAFFLSYILGGTTDYEEKKKTYYSLTTALIKNKKLASLLEKACKEKYGILTYPEYLTIEQFSKYGYHGTHKTYGATPTETYWPQALTTLCQRHNIHSLVEFGPGDGSMGLRAVKEARQKDYDLRWSGIEIDPQLQKRIHKNFASEKLTDALSSVTTTIESMHFQEKCLFVCSYSLDSIPPYLFTNTTKKKSYPNALIGLTINGQEIREVIIPEETLKRKHLNLENGIFTDEHGQKYDLRSWKLIPYQKAYITTESFFTLQQIVTKLPKGSLILIIDEFLENLPFWNTQHLFIPRDVELFDRTLKNKEKFYEEAGGNVLYYLSFFDTYQALLRQFGCTNIHFSEEHLAVEYIKNNDSLPDKLVSFSYCYALLATVGRKPQFSTLTITYPQKANS